MDLAYFRLRILPLIARLFVFVPVVILAASSIGLGQEASETEDIRDIIIQPPGPNRFPWIMGLAVGVLALALIWLAVRRLFSKQGSAGPPPEVTARQRLRAIRDKLEETEPNRSSLQTSEVVKDFLTELSNDPIRFETVEEYLGRISEPANSAFSSRLTEEIRSFMSISQELKFANLKQAQDRVPALVQQAEAIIAMAVSEKNNE